ncbi:MAG: DUF4810 domain-containing protein [Bacteroidota bacterium]|nr:DUF4810 domain-containing protein [Bacteroidota bacterium]
MKKIAILSLMLIALASCTTTVPSLYTWNNYSEATYNYIKSRSDADKVALMKTYDVMIKKQAGLRKCVPPGVYADYGFLLIQAGETDKGRDMLNKEIELYPESKTLIAHLLNSTAK